MGPWRLLLADLAGQWRIAGHREGWKGEGGLPGEAVRSCLRLSRPLVKASNPKEFRVHLGCKGSRAAGLAPSQPFAPPQLQELLEYMRKLEARLEKVADEKWNEDTATEDEEGAAGLSMYTPNLVTPPPHSTSPRWESST